jgi:hypothetical protein
MLTDTPLSVADVLERAAEKIGAPGAWYQGDFAQRDDGKCAYGDDPRARCWCALGAIQAAAHHAAFRSSAQARLERLVGNIPDWNDAPERTQPEVVTALRRAATLARAGDA